MPSHDGTPTKRELFAQTGYPTGGEVASDPEDSPTQPAANNKWTVSASPTATTASGSLQWSQRSTPMASRELSPTARKREIQLVPVEPPPETEHMVGHDMNQGAIEVFTSNDLPLASTMGGSLQLVRPTRSGVSGSGRSAVSLSHASSTTKYLIRTLEEKISDQRTQMAVKDRQIDSLMSRISESGGSLATSLASISSIHKSAGVGTNPAHSTIKIDVNNHSNTDLKAETTADHAHTATTSAMQSTLTPPAPEIPLVEEDMEGQYQHPIRRRARVLLRGPLRHVVAHAPKTFGNWMLCFAVGLLVQSNFVLRQELGRQRRQNFKRRGIASRAREVIRDKFDVWETLS